MKHFFTSCLFIGIALGAVAQLDKRFYGKYMDPRKESGFVIVPAQANGDVCFNVQYALYNEHGDKIHEEVATGSCTTENDGYPITFGAGEPTLWLKFSSDALGVPILTTVLEEGFTKDYIFSEHPLDVQGGFYTDRAPQTPGSLYETASGAQLFFQDGDNPAFTLIGLISSACDENAVDGLLEKAEGTQPTYVYRTDGCVLLFFNVEPLQITITENPCGEAHPKECPRWTGVYLKK